MSNIFLQVVVTNQLTTRLTKPVATKSELAPALGETLGHRVNQRILLGRTATNSIAAILLKGNGESSLTAKFQVSLDLEPKQLNTVIVMCV